MNTDFPFRPKKIISFTLNDSYDEDDASDTEITTNVQDFLDTSHILSDELYESKKSVTTEYEHGENEDEEMKRYITVAMILYLTARQ